MSYRGRVRNGVIVLDSEAVLPEGAIVTVEQIEQAPGATDGGWARELPKIAGTATGLPSDLARNHDHYLYGTPKR